MILFKSNTYNEAPIIRQGKLVLTREQVLQGKIITTFRKHTQQKLRSLSFDKSTAEKDLSASKISPAKIIRQIYKNN